MKSDNQIQTREAIVARYARLAADHIIERFTRQAPKAGYELRTREGQLIRLKNKSSWSRKHDLINAFFDETPMWWISAHEPNRLIDQISAFLDNLPADVNRRKSSAQLEKDVFQRILDTGEFVINEIQ